jgi:hypothetical protein
MATPIRSSREPQWQQWLARLVPARTLANALALAHRYREVESLQLYVQDRKRLLVPATFVLFLIGVGCAISVVVYLADFHALLALLAILLLPIVLIGSLFVLAYVFFSWIEGRALARELGPRHRAAPGAAARWLSDKFGIDIGPAPQVPWVLAAIFLLAPLGLLAASSWAYALAVLLLGVLMPLAYAKFDG